MKLLYFAWVREKIGRSEEELSVPEGIGDVEALIAWLRERGPAYSDALSDMSLVRVAVNQDHADLTTKIADTDEVALFPPVTGGAA